MGSGKSSAAITYMNENSDKKFLYITPYLKEAERIVKACLDLKFEQPRNDIKEYEYSKSVHLMSLLEQGKNIATTHSLFKMYDVKEFDAIRKFGYTLIIDESLDVAVKYATTSAEIEDALELGYIKIDEDGRFVRGEKNRKNSKFNSLANFVDARHPMSEAYSNGKYGISIYWIFSPEFVRAFEDVFVLTYMFKAQDMRCFFDANGIEYEYIGVKKDEDGIYRFGKYQEYIPPYVKDIKDKIHIFDHRMNEVGEKKTALSMSWYKTKKDETEQIYKNLVNLYSNIIPSGSRDKLMVGIFSSQKYSGGIARIKKKCVAFNERATNRYADKTILAYCVNIFVDVGIKKYYTSHGVYVDQDGYALSTMIQWIWRSAIRNGQEIWLYLPSKRMRKLLTDWMDSVSELSQTQE